MFEGFIGLAKQIKGYLTPQYANASKSLYLVTNFVYEDNQKISFGWLSLRTLIFQRRKQRFNFWNSKKDLIVLKLAQTIITS